MRVENLGPWIAEWDLEEINSGVPGKGATDAWYRSALQIELIKLQGGEVAGGSVDVFRCFGLNELGIDRPECGGCRNAQEDP